MFRFEAFAEEHLLAFLQGGLLDTYFPELLKRFFLFSPKVQYEIIIYLRERLRETISPKVLAKFLSLSKGDSEKILFTPGRPFEIILTGRDLSKPSIQAKAARGLVIPGTSRLFTNLSHLSRKLKIVKDYVGQSFAVIFDTYFQGDSFMLPLAVALRLEEVPRDLRFSGKINQRGDILEVGHLQAKISFCKEHNLRLIAPPRVKNISQIEAFLKRRDWAIPLYITSAGKEEYKSFLEAITPEVSEDLREYLQNLELFYGLTEEDFFISTGQLKEPTRWVSTCQAFHQRLYHINNTLSGTKLYHLAMRGPVALSFALGVLFSHFNPFIFYHYQAIEGKTHYYPLKVLTPRILKERIQHLKIIKHTLEKKGDNLVAILNFSHHEPTSDVRRFVENHLSRELGEIPSMLIVETEWKGNLPLDKFIPVAQETASLLQNLRAEFSFRSYHFFFSCPVALAFMVGLAFGHYVDGKIYNYQREGSTYEAVLDFRTLRNIREENVRSQ